MARSPCLADLAEQPGPSNLHFNLASFEEKAGLAVTKQEELKNNGNRHVGRVVRPVLSQLDSVSRPPSHLRLVFFFFTSDQQHICAGCAVVKVI